MLDFPDVHSRSIVVAAHTDIVGADVDYWRVRGDRGVLERRHVPTLRAGGVTVVCDHIGGDSRYAYLPATTLHTTSLQRVMRMLDHCWQEVAESESILIALGVDDIARAKREGKIALVICLEGASPLEDELACLRNLYRLGLRCLGLTHNWRNSLADGVLERSGGGLTHFGVEVVQECNALGIVVDVSHLSDRGVEDTLAFSRHPIIASHSNARAVHKHVRNLTDEQIRAIAQAGGVIGIHALNALVSDTPQPPLDEMLRHAEHMASVGGVECVGIGPDLLENWQEGIFKAVTEGAPKCHSVPVKKMSYQYPTGMTSLADLPNITRGLLARGFKEAEVEKILGANFIRVFDQVWSVGAGRGAPAGGARR